MSTIYIDVLFFINFILNITILNAEAILLHIHPKPARLITGAILGALYSCLTFVADFKALGFAITKIIFATLMSNISFGTKRMRPLIKQTAFLFVITAFMGMFIMALLYFTDIGLCFGGMVRKGVFYFNIPLWFVFPSCILATATAVITQKALEKSATRNCVKLKITYRKKSIYLNALTDTGNHLRDPFSGKRVVIAEEKILKNLLEETDFLKICSEECQNLPLGFRLIPFSSIGKQNGLLPAFLPDEILVNGEKKGDLVVAVFKGSLSRTGDYNALISPEESKRKDVTPCLKKS